MKCCICDGEIDKHYTPEGKMYWGKGHDPAPVKTGKDDRCCDNCERVVVMPARLVDKLGLSRSDALEVAKGVTKVGIEMSTDLWGQMWDMGVKQLKKNLKWQRGDGEGNTETHCGQYMISADYHSTTRAQGYSLRFTPADRAKGESLGSYDTQSQAKEEASCHKASQCKEGE